MPRHAMQCKSAICSNRRARYFTYLSLQVRHFRCLLSVLCSIRPSIDYASKQASKRARHIQLARVSNAAHTIKDKRNHPPSSSQVSETSKNAEHKNILVYRPLQLPQVPVPASGLRPSLSALNGVAFPTPAPPDDDICTAVAPLQRSGVMGLTTSFSSLGRYTPSCAHSLSCSLHVGGDEYP